MNFLEWLLEGRGFFEWTDDLSPGGASRAWVRIINFFDGSGSSNARYADPRMDPRSISRYPIEGLGSSKLPATDELSMPYVGHQNMSPAPWSLDWGLSTTYHEGLRATAVDSVTWFGEVSDGRNMRYNRLHGRFFLDQPNFSSEPLFQQQYELLSGLTHIAKTSRCRYLVFGATKTGGVLNLEGAAYAMLRLCVDNHQWDSASQAVTRTPRVPGLHVLEVGLVTNGKFVSQKRLLYNGGGYGNRIDFGVARSSEFIDAPDMVVFTSAYGVGEVVSLKFPFQTASADATIFCNADSVVANATFGGFLQLSAANNSPIGPLLRQLDFGELIPCAHFAGAAATTPFAESDVMLDTMTQRRFMERYPRSPAWAAWEHSKYPYTLHAGFRLGVVGPEQTPWNKLSKTPVYDVRPEFENYGTEPTDPSKPLVVINTSELIPVHEVAARSATLIGSAIANDRSGRNEAAPYIMSCDDDNPFIINGKKVTKVTLKFEPYLNADQNFETDIERVNVPNPLFPSYDGSTGRAEDGWVAPEGLVYFDYTSTVPVPAGKTALFDSQIHRGTYLEARGFAGGDTKKTTTVNEGMIPVGTVQKIIALRVSKINAINRMGGSGVPETIAGLFGFPAVFEIPDVPIAGEYPLTRFSCGGIPAAGNAFRYAGGGAWDQQCEFVYKKYLQRETINDFWVPFPSPDLPNTVWPSISRNYAGAPVVVTEKWQSAAMYVEVHARLGVGLQERGTFDPDDESLVVAPDNPAGRMVEMATYAEGYEPAAALHIKILARVVPAATLTIATDNSELPADYPWELEETEAPGVSDPKPSGLFKELSHQFNAAQTRRLLDGESVAITNWQSKPFSHVLIEFGVPHRVICTLETEPA